MLEKNSNTAILKNIVSEKKIVLDPNLNKVSDRSSKLWIPINRSILSKLETEVNRISNLHDLILRIKSDVGLLLMIPRYENFYRPILERTQFDRIKITKQDLNEFLSLVYSHEYFDLHELHEVQISTIKITSIFSTLHDLFREQSFFNALRPLLPYVYFTFYTPTWFEKTIKKSEGSFENLILRGLDCGPVRSSDVEQYFKFEGLVDQPVLECFNRYRPLICLSGSTEPELFYDTASQIDEYVKQVQATSREISAELIEQQLQKWHLKWGSSLPKKFSRALCLNELKEVAKRTRGIKLLEQYRGSLKILETSDDILSEFLSEVRTNQPSVEAIKVLFEKIIPSVGFNLAIVYLADQVGNILVPKVKFGSAKTLNIPVITTSRFSLEEEPIVDAFSNSRVVKIEEGNLLGIDGSFFVIPFDYENHKGVFIVGTEPEDPRSVTLEALKSAQTCANLLGMALGY